MPSDVRVLLFVASILGAVAATSSMFGWRAGVLAASVMIFAAVVRG